ncbi:MAG: General secretion pathway, M protein [Marinobacter excellens HL-55]|uniref:General secretion pathway, M protein n=1 Tax=Marinobacter excellens HL-55 TaxID=1305731 RepID=A0A0P7ZD69_9GAMM|nr:MAG: General secretion pathway, M protein [Marinobacter excellens HL-55]
MPTWSMILLQVLLTVIAVTAVLFAFWYLIVRPWLSAKVQELIEAADQVEPKVAQGVQRGVADAVRDLPQNAWDGATKESTKQFMKFGSNLFENGLSSFLGTAAELQKSRAEAQDRSERDDRF